MSALVQIESAVAGLPEQDQWSLLTWLQVRLHSSGKQPTVFSMDRQAWLRELVELQEHTRTSHEGVPLQDLMDDLREERS